MCGIFGHYAPDGAEPPLIERMAARLAHRGPDGWGMRRSADGMLAFGAGRLAIIDLAADAGALANEDGRVSVVFNGEIYNHKPLRAQLEAAGHRFSTHTDTEVIVHGYEEWGDAVLERLRGMFALALWDERGERGRLLLARDRAGEKPLYIADLGGGEWLFASEIKALFEHPRLRPAVNHDALWSWFVLGYTPAPHTLFAGVRKLAAGSYLILEAGQAHEGIYWQPHVDTVHPAALPYSDALRAVRAALETTVEAQMMSDVPIGAFLSGGVDSSAVVALMTRLTGQPVQTFTVGFDYPAGSPADHKFNVDARYAAQVAEALKTDHHLITLRQDETLGDLLLYLVAMLDEPILQTTIVQSAYVAALARAMGVPVLLNGEGGDELFLGYNHYRADRVVERYRLLPRALRGGIGALADRLPSARFDPLRELSAKAKPDDAVARYLNWSRVNDSHRAAALLPAAHDHGQIDAALRPHLTAPDVRWFAERIAYANLRSHLADCLNLRVDKMSMAMSIEARAPLEDTLMIELALNLPPEYKLRAGDFKRIFKDAVRDLLPAPVLTRPKWGFNPPASDWLRGALRPLVERVLTPERINAAGVWSLAAVAGLIERHIHQRGYELFPLWAALVFHLWHGVYIEGDLTPTLFTPADLYPTAERIRP